MLLLLTPTYSLKTDYIYDYLIIRYSLIVKRSVSLLLLIILGTFVQAQNLRDDLLRSTWYCEGDLNDSILKLSSVQTANFQFSLKMNKSGTLIRTSVNGTFLDSLYKGKFQKNSFTLSYYSKDSTLVYWYNVISSNKKNYQMKKMGSLRNIRNGKDTVGYDFFWLSKKNKTRNIFLVDNITVKTDQTKTKGSFFMVKGDSIYVDSAKIARDYFAITGRDTVPPKLKAIAFQDLKYIKHERKKLNKVMNWCIAGSVISALIISPAVSFEGSNFNYDRAAMISSVSMATLPVFITGRYVFSHKKMRVGTEAKKSWRIW